MNVAVIGASPKTDRFAYKAFKLLTDYGHSVFLVNPAFTEIEGHPVYKTVGDIPVPIHTLTLYIGAAKSDILSEDCLNYVQTGSSLTQVQKNATLKKKMEDSGVQALEACTLVLLQSGRFLA